MWTRINNISLKQLGGGHLENPNSQGQPIILDLFQREFRTAFWIVRNKKVIPQFLDKNTGLVIPKNKWTANMQSFVQSEIEKLSPQKGWIKITVLGWIFILLAAVFLGYLIYDGMQAQERVEKFQQKITKETSIREGDIYLGRIEMYKEKGIPLGMKGEFGYFKVIKINGDIYQIAKSKEMSPTAKPKEQLNNTEFEEKSIDVKAKNIEAYYKAFVSEDGLVQITFSEKKE